MQEKQSFHPFLTILVVFLAVFVNFMLVSSGAINSVLTFLAMLFNSALALVFLFANLKTEYSQEGIQIKFFPFLRKKKTIAWKEIKSAGVREYSPIKEYGGWGVRYSLNGRAYNTQGKWGLQLEFKDDKKLLIGTQQPEKLQKFIEQLKLSSFTSSDKNQVSPPTSKTKHPITESRKVVLDAMVGTLREAWQKHGKLDIQYICTHNSRRSQLAELLTSTIAHELNMKDIHSWSGGTEATAFNHRVVKALQEHGIALEAVNSGENPRYRLKLDGKEKLFFSKLHDDPFNAADGFVAVTVCSDAEANCPYIPNALSRFHLPYQDPKAYDDSPLETEKYHSKVIEVETEIRYILTKLKDAMTS